MILSYYDMADQNVSNEDKGRGEPSNYVCHEERIEGVEQGMQYLGSIATENHESLLQMDTRIDKIEDTMKEIREMFALMMKASGNKNVEDEVHGNISFGRRTAVINEAARASSKAANYRESAGPTFSMGTSAAQEPSISDRSKV